MSLISPMVQVVVIGPDNKIYERQPYSEFITNPHPNIQAAAYGTTFLDLLTQEGLLTEKLVLRNIFTGNAHADATRLCGNLAEALVVRYCNLYPDINRTLATYARFGERERKSLDNFQAVGAASKLTANNYPQHYQPSDTQRDIIWIDKSDSARQLACVGGNALSSKPAGLQVKASHDGCKYIIPSIRDYFYPILYFDLSDDWHVVQNELVRRQLPATLIHPDEIMREIKSHLFSYYGIVISLIRNETSIEKVIRNAIYAGESALLAGLSASELYGFSSIILQAEGASVER